LNAITKILLIKQQNFAGMEGSMKPLETHLEMSSHLWMFNRVKELLTREGLLTRYASEEDIRVAMNRWIEMVEGANKDLMIPH
jgi:hypothetical protein